MGWESIGHAWAKDLLAGHLARGSLHHAYLMDGASGLGKLALARRFAQSLLCQSGSFPPCRDCSGCQRVESLSHPDYEELSSPGVGESLQIDQIRRMQRRIALAPYEADRRVVLLHRAHELTREAANALLKTLEEPPDHVLLLLTTESMEALPATLTSRCEVLKLRGVAPAEIMSALEPEHGLETSRLVAHLSGGRPGKASALAQDSELLADRQQALDDLQRLLQGDRMVRFAFADGWSKVPREEDLAWLRRRTHRLLREWLSLMRDVMLGAHDALVEPANVDQAERIATLRDRLSARQATAAAGAIKGCMDAIHDNGNVQLALEVLMLRLPEVAAN